MREQINSIECDLPAGWSAFSHVLRGYDSPDRWLTAAHTDGRRVEGSTIDELRAIIPLGACAAPYLQHRTERPTCARHPPGRLLGLHGRAGAGKSTIAQAMIADGSAALLHFASPIKSMGRAIGLTEAQVNGAEKDRPTALLGGGTPRRFLQQLGRHLRDTHDANVVASWTLVDVDRLLAHGLDVILDDVRLPSEAAAVWSRHGVVIELTGRSSIALDSDAASDVLEQRLEDRFVHDTIANCAQVDEVARAVKHCWHDTIACVGASRAW